MVRASAGRSRWMDAVSRSIPMHATSTARLRLRAPLILRSSCAILAPARRSKRRSNGKAPPGSSFLPKLDQTGRVVAFGTQRFGEYQTGALIVRNLDDGSFTTESTDCAFYGVSISADVSIVVRDGDFGCLDPMVFMNVEPRVLGAGGDSEVSPDGRYVVFDAGLDPYSVDYQEYGGDFGAMVYDRATERFTAAYKW